MLANRSAFDFPDFVRPISLNYSPFNIPCGVFFATTGGMHPFSGYWNTKGSEAKRTNNSRVPRAGTGMMGQRG
jgi:hypothetical protein